jgi:hypothetical protein
MAVRGIFVFVILRGAVELLRMGLNRSLEVLARLIRESGERVSGSVRRLADAAIEIIRSSS